MAINNERLDIEEVLKDLSADLEKDKAAPEIEEEEELEPVEDQSEDNDADEDDEADAAPEKTAEEEAAESTLTPEEIEAKRKEERRADRQRKQQKKREWTEGMQAKIAAQEMELKELRQSMTGVQKHQVDTTLGTYEARVREAKANYDKANEVIALTEAKMQEAQKTGDMVAMSQAMLARDQAKEIRDRVNNEGLQALNDYNRIKEASTAAPSKAQGPHPFFNHPETAARRDAFLTQPWLNDLTQAQKARLTEIDVMLTKQGRDMRTDGYWDALTSQAKKEFSIQDQKAAPRAKTTVGGKGQGQVKATTTGKLGGEVPAGVIAAWRKMGQDVGDPKRLDALKRNYFEQHGRK